jgi:hypothetical protein
MAAAEGSISAASEVWGGRNFLIIPTDGLRIREKFWEILKVYNPDHIATYNLTLRDLETSQPAEYAKAEQAYREHWEAQGSDLAMFDDWFAKSAEISLLDELTLSDDLKKQILDRLSPFHLQGDVIQQWISRSSGFRFPFTQIADIIPYATRHIGEIVLPKQIEDPTAALMAHSQTGYASPDYRAKLEAHQFSVRPLPREYNTADFLEHVFGGQALGMRAGDTWQRLDEYMPRTPFGVSMLHLNMYYKANVHLAYKEPVIVIIGDTVDDFCLYYSLSRLHENVRWMPLAWLRSAYSLYMANVRRHERHEAIQDLSDQQRTVTKLVNLYFDLIEHGTGEKTLQLCSMSLSVRQLIAYKRQMATLCMFGRPTFSSKTICIPVDKISTTCIVTVFEEDNYSNNESAVFIDGRTVSPLVTPRPKNFSAILPTGHYWVASLQIENYQPPQVEGLGAQLIQTTGFPVDVRVAIDGIAYHCPNAAYFGGGIDANLVRPRIRLLDEMALLGSYFATIGIDIRYSDKGNYFRDTIRRFGSLDETGEFIKSASTRTILDKYITRAGSEDGTVIFLTNDQRAYLNLQAFKVSVGDLSKAAALIDDLVSKNVVERGYILQCSRCRLASWYSISVLTSEFTCSRCSFQQQFTHAHWKHPIEPHWYYKLAETIYQFYENNSHLTVQALYKLKSTSKRAFHYVPEIELLNFPKTGDKKELDIACILDGVIIIGEAKTEALRARDVTKFEGLVNKFGHEPGRVVFATNKQEVSAEFQARISALPMAEVFTFADMYDV